MTAADCATQVPYSDFVLVSVANIAHHDHSESLQVRLFRAPLHNMPRPIISPSVLASDFGQLTAECTRMIKGGAERLHMGECNLISFATRDPHHRPQMSWMGAPFTCRSARSCEILTHIIATLYRTSPWVNSCHTSLNRRLTYYS